MAGIHHSWGAAAVVALGAGAVFSACAVGPDFSRPDAAVTASWQAHDDPRLSTRAGPDSAWWRSFDDPVLDRLIDLAQQQNLPLQISGLRIVEARARLGIATGNQFPQIQQLFGSASLEKISQGAANVTALQTHFADFQTGFDAAWELDFWGKYRRGVQAEAASLLATVADYQSALVSLSAEVARTYVVIRTFEVLLELAQQNVKVQEEGLRIAESRFRNGATSELDPAQATTLLESTRATVPQLQAGLQQARNALGTLLGQPTGTVEALLTGPRQIPTAPAQVAVSVPAEMLRRRPDIRGAELTAAAQCARIGVAKAELYPSFTLLGSIGLEVTNSTAHNFFSVDNLFYSLGPHITWPFLNYDRIENRVRVEDARFQQSLVSYRNTVLRAAQEVEDAISGFLDSQQAAVFEQRSVVAAQRSVQLAMDAYREGATDYQRVLDAERSLLQQQNAFAETQSQVVTNLIALFKALGGGWELRQGEPFVPAPTQVQMKQRTDWGDMLTQPRSPERR